MNLREMRRAVGMTAAQAAEKTGVTFGNLCDFERGDAAPTVPVLVKLLKAYGKGALARRIIRQAQGASLKRLRVARGWTQADAGNELDSTMSQAALSRIESGRAELSADTLLDLLAAYGRDEQAEELRTILEPATRHGNQVYASAATRHAAKMARAAERKSVTHSNGRNDPGHLAGVVPQADPVRMPDGREVPLPKRPARPARTG